MNVRVSIGDFRTLAAVAVLIAVTGIAACGDIENTDPRQGYTKAPLEEPGLFVGAEEPTEMDRLGDPRLYLPGEELPPFVLAPGS